MMNFTASNLSGQIIATSHDLTPNGGLVREITLFQENPGWWNIIFWPESFWNDQVHEAFERIVRHYARA